MVIVVGSFSERSAGGRDWGAMVAARDDFGFAFAVGGFCFLVDVH